MKRYLTGSALFFRSFKDFIPHDLDYVEIVESQNLFKKEMPTNNCDVFRYKRGTIEEYIDYSLNQSRCPMELGTYLVPCFCKEIGMTINDLQKLESLKNKIDYEHQYLIIIYDSYIKNNGFFLTTSQLNEAYKEYKKERNIE